MHSLFPFQSRINLLQQKIFKKLLKRIFAKKIAKSYPIQLGFTTPKTTCHIYGTFTSYRPTQNYMPIHFCINFGTQQSSSQSLLLQQHPVLSRNLDFDRSSTIFTPLCPGVLHTVYHLLPKASAFLKALSQKKEIRVKLPCMKASWWGISTFVLAPHLR